MKNVDISTRPDKFVMRAVTWWQEQISY